MSAHPLPQQFAIQCDWCKGKLDFDGIELYFPAERLVEGPREHGWRSLDSKHMCSICSEDRGVDVDDLAEGHESAAIEPVGEGER
jgi:hypothetical protein